MRFRRRSRFHDLVERQLDLFAADDAEILTEAAEAEAAWNASPAADAEEAYGDYQLVVRTVARRGGGLRVQRRVHAGRDQALPSLHDAARGPGRVSRRRAEDCRHGSSGSRGCRKRASLRCVVASRRRPCWSSERPSA